VALWNCRQKVGFAAQRSISPELKDRSSGPGNPTRQDGVVRWGKKTNVTFRWSDKRLCCFLLPIVGSAYALFPT
jgi:hypothetical protein